MPRIILTGKVSLFHGDKLKASIVTKRVQTAHYFLIQYVLLNLL